MSKHGKYKITIKGDDINAFEDKIQARIDYMLNSFEMTAI